MKDIVLSYRLCVYERCSMVSVNGVSVVDVDVCGCVVGDNERSPPHGKERVCAQLLDTDRNIVISIFGSIPIRTIRIP